MTRKSFYMLSGSGPFKSYCFNVYIAIPQKIRQKLANSHCKGALNCTVFV